MLAAHMESTNLPLPGDARWRRVLGVALFLGLLYFFRKLAPVFICFVVMERALGFLADQIALRTRMKRTRAIAVVLTALTTVLGLVAFLAVRRALPVVAHIRTDGNAYLQSLVEHPAVQKARHMAGLDGESLSHAVKAHAGEALHYATGTAHLLLFVLIGVVLAIIYLFERDELEELHDDLPPNSVLGTLTRWFGYVSDAIAVTVRMQVVVAIVNAVVTLPVLLVLGLPKIPLLFLLILVTGLLPVVGNIISGAVLCYVAFVAKGPWSVAIFLAVTFVLHKIESYYLNPRLAAEHVKLPGLVLVISLLLFEQAFGFVGLFLSFPSLYVASRIADEWKRGIEPRKRRPSKTEPGEKGQNTAQEPAAGDEAAAAESEQKTDREPVPAE
jgi:predicted PurR-regulated permease PerM